MPVCSHRGSKYLKESRKKGTGTLSIKGAHLNHYGALLSFHGKYIKGGQTMFIKYLILLYTLTFIIGARLSLFHTMYII